MKRSKVCKEIENTISYFNHLPLDAENRARMASMIVSKLFGDMKVPFPKWKDENGDVQAGWEDE